MAHVRLELAMSGHLWITGARRADHAAAAAVHEPDAVADCHRRLRGPFTGTGSLMRAVVPQVDSRRPELTARHAIEIIAVAPEASTPSSARHRERLLHLPLSKSAPAGIPASGAGASRMGSWISCGNARPIAPWSSRSALWTRRTRPIWSSFPSPYAA